jgi:hypothetical protein
MATSCDHYFQAEYLLAEGQAVVARISVLADERKVFNTDGTLSLLDYERVTREMDELGKKAIGIWAQAQIHATLATARAI